MNDYIHKFKGDVDVYLQGRNALVFLEMLKNTISYLVGSPNSPILIRDHRKEPNNAAYKVINGIENVDFATIFNQPASIDLKETTDGIVIDMKECADRNQKDLILWMGLLDNEMPIRETIWEHLIPVEDDQTAFAALVL